MSLETDLHTRFNALLQQHRGIVLKVATSYCWNPDDRAELAQDLTVQLWRAFPGYDAGRRFSTWMYRIALNVAISDLRGRSRAPQDPLPLERWPTASPPRWRATRHTRSRSPHSMASSPSCRRWNAP